MLRPLQNRLIIKPDPPETESAGGILIPQTAGKPPAMSGTVISVGKGPATAHRIRQATIAHCLHLLEDVAARVPGASLRMELEDEFARYAVEDVTFSEVSSGDYVCFAYTAGQNMTIDGESFIVIEEGDVQAVWQKEHVA